MPGERQILLRRSRIITESRQEVAPGDGGNRGCIRIDHQLIGIEAVPFMRSVRPGEAEAVELAGPDSFQPHMPDIARLVADSIEKDTATRRGIVDAVEEVDAGACSMAAENGKIDAVVSGAGPQGKRDAGTDGLNLAETQQPLHFVELLISVFA
jgi:hypothetical protein